MSCRCASVIVGSALFVFLALLASGSSAHAQSTTQLLIQSGFNPIAATTPELRARLMKFPEHQFVQRHKGDRQYYVYADPSGCSCALVGNAVAMEKYRANFSALPMDALSSGGFANPEQNMINSMENDDEEGQFNTDAFDPGF